MCKPTEVFLKCGSACPTTCANRNEQYRICTMQCVIGCGCPKNKVRRETDELCVDPSEC